MPYYFLCKYLDGSLQFNATEYEATTTEYLSTIFMTTMTSDPTNEPTNEPSYEPTIEPTNEPTTAEPTEQPTKTPTDDPDEEDIFDQQFRCRYRDSLPDLVPLQSRYGTIFGNAILRTISSLQSDLWTERGCSVIDFIICTVFTIDIINDSCKTDAFDTDSTLSLIHI